MEGLRVLKGIRPEQVPEVAALLVRAFSLKVQHELRPRTLEQARQIIVRSIVPDRGWVAVDEKGMVVGVVGVGTRDGCFSHMSFRLLASEFGFLGAIPRWLLAEGQRILTRPTRHRWHVESLAVDEVARGKGIGTKLLTSAIKAARDEGMSAVDLEVVDVNDVALRLYERIGFRKVFTLPTGWLTARGGYRGVHFMRLDL